MLLKKNVGLIAIMLVFTLVVASCGVLQKKKEDKPLEEIPSSAIEETMEDTNMRKTVLYYQDDSGFLVPVMRRIPWEEGIAKAALRKLMDTPEQQEEFMNMGLRPLLPANAKINGMSIKDGLAKVDFNSEVMECEDALAESNMVHGIVLTLAEFPTIDRVQLLFDGKIVDELKFGTKVGEPIEPKDINPEISPDAKGDGAKVTVFFHATSPSQYEYLVPVTRVTSATVATLETAMEELLKGPSVEGNLNMDIPDGTKLIGVQMDEGVAYINFSKEFEGLADSPASEAMVLKSIIMTAKEFPEVQDVKILVEGKEYEGADFLSAPTFINEY